MSTRYQDIAQQRLYNQHISAQRFERAEEVVQWLGAVQAQDYGAAKWALGQRLRNGSEEAIEQAFTEGAVLRTHVMRPTWHFVVPEDIRWLLVLTAPRVHAANASYPRQLGLGEAFFARSDEALGKALQGGKQLTRTELAEELKRAGLAIGDDLRLLGHLMMHAELEGIICSGARRGKQFTYALLDERVPQGRVLEREEALAEFARRYFTGHGPATVQDFVWWSGLTVADARAGLEMVRAELQCEQIDGQDYWFAHAIPSGEEFGPGAHLLPNYDEYIVGYKDRSAIFDNAHVEQLDSRGNVLFMHTIVLDGRVGGTWRQTIRKSTVDLTPSFFTGPGKDEQSAFVEAAKRYGAFLGKAVNVLME